MKYVVDLSKSLSKSRMIRLTGLGGGGPGTGKRGRDLKKRKQRAGTDEMHQRDLQSENWHTRSMASMKDKSEESLRFIIKDATEAADAGEKMGNPKAGQYRDEAHYANMELTKRGLQKSDVRVKPYTRGGHYVKGHVRKLSKQAKQALIAATTHQIAKDKLIPKKAARAEAKGMFEKPKKPATYLTKETLHTIVEEAKKINEQKVKDKPLKELISMYNTALKEGQNYKAHEVANEIIFKLTNMRPKAKEESNEQRKSSLLTKFDRAMQDLEKDSWKAEQRGEQDEVKWFNDASSYIHNFYQSFKIGNYLDSYLWLQNAKKMGAEELEYIPDEVIKDVEKYGKPEADEYKREKIRKQNLRNIVFEFPAEDFSEERSIGITGYNILPGGGDGWNEPKYGPEVEDIKAVWADTGEPLTDDEYKKHIENNRGIQEAIIEHEDEDYEQRKAEAAYDRREDY